MKRKTIEKIINEKVTSWLNSINNITIRQYLTDKIIVTGGCITSMLLGEKINDFDIYFRTKQAAKEIANYYIKKFNVGKNYKDIEVIDESSNIKIKINSSGIIVIPPEKNKKYTPVCITANAITLSNKIQLIVKFFGEPKEIHEGYDYIHCTNYWTSWDKKLVTSVEALESILSKELVYTNSKYPLASIIRMRKFIKRGWNINAGQILKMCYQLSELDLKDEDVLEDQLTGVDLMYFSDLISRLKNDNKEIDYSYLPQLIDEIF